MAQEFQLRKAILSDMKKVFELSNDDLVRANSINKNKINWEEHKNWFEKRISNNDPFYIAEFNDDFIGQIRIENKNGENIISLSITKKFRGQNLASKIIKEAIKKSGLKSVVAYIYGGNTASIKSFQKAGFKTEGDLKYIVL